MARLRLFEKNKLLRNAIKKQKPIEEVQKCLRNFINLDILDWNPLVTAIDTNNLIAAKLLIEAYPKFIHKEDKDKDEIPLQTAFRCGQLELAILIFRCNGQKYVSKSDKDGNCLIHFAAMQSNIEFLNLCLKYSDLNMLNMKRETALHIAAELDNFEVLKCLLNWGALSYANFEGKHPLHLVAAKGFLQSAKLLLKYFGGMNTRNRFVCSPLMCAIQYQKAPLIKLLLNKKTENVDKLIWLNAIKAKNDSIFELVLTSQQNKLSNEIFIGLMNVTVEQNYVYGFEQLMRSCNFSKVDVTIRQIFFRAVDDSPNQRFAALLEENIRKKEGLFKSLQKFFKKKPTQTADNTLFRSHSNENVTKNNQMFNRLTVTKTK